MKVVVFKGAFGQMVATTSEELVRKLTAAAAAITAAAAAREGRLWHLSGSRGCCLLPRALSWPPSGCGRARPAPATPR